MELVKVEKLVTNLHDKNVYAVHIRSLKQALNHGVILKNAYRLNQEDWLEAYIKMNVDLRKIAKKWF